MSSSVDPANLRRTRGVRDFLRRVRAGRDDRRRWTAPDSGPVSARPVSARTRGELRLHRGREPADLPCEKEHRAMSTATGWPGLDAPLAEADPEVYGYITDELHRQQQTLEMIASENFAPVASMQAQGSVLTNKYAEGYPGRRYYGGCEFVDEIERPGHRPDQGAVRRRVRQRAAALRRPGQRRRDAGADQAGRHHPGPVAGARRPPDPRDADQLLRPAVPRGRLRGVQGGPPRRHGQRGRAGPRALGRS